MSAGAHTQPAPPAAPQRWLPWWSVALPVVAFTVLLALRLA
ncbi:hypothetical protein [Streptomyces sp. MAR4 CNX-425]